jgi:NitT/TauT family transport system substrate-binding protein
MSEITRRDGRVLAVLLVLVALLGCQAAPAATPSRQVEGARTASQETERPAAPAAGPALPTVRVAYGAGVGSMAPLWMAKASGAFERHGAPAEVVSIQSSASIAALVAGEIDLVQVSAPGMLPAALQGEDLVFIAGALNNMVHSVHVRPSIASAADLRGQVWGSDRPGTPNDFATQMGLGRLGLTPADVQVLGVGSSDQLLQALLAGQLGATVLAPPHSFAAEDAGYPMLLDLYDVPYQTIGLVGIRSRLPRLEASLVPLLKAYREGVDRYYGDKPLALQVLAEYSRIDDPRTLERTYEFYRARGFNRDLRVSEPGVQNVIDFLAKTLPAAQGARAAQFIEYRYLDQLPPD